MNRIGKRVFTMLSTLLLASGMLQARADSLPYEGTATLCFLGGVPPTVRQEEEGRVTYVSDMVSLYYIQTTPAGADRAAGLVNGWELLTSSMKITGAVYRVNWMGILVPSAYADATGTVLTETAVVETEDLSRLSGTWQGTGELAGTSVDYLLTLMPGAEPDCPKDPPPQCAGMEGGCRPAEPPFVETAIVYAMSGAVY